MSEEKKCCGCCKDKELSNEQLERVNGGHRWAGLGNDSHLENGHYICTSWSNKSGTCNKHKTVDGVENVCICPSRTDGSCCRVYKEKCTCPAWVMGAGDCINL